MKLIEKEKALAVRDSAHSLHFLLARSEEGITVQTKDRGGIIQLCLASTGEVSIGVFEQRGNFIRLVKPVTILHFEDDPPAA